jgi:hypothetical protein
MASYTWAGVSGDWNLASDWTPAGGPPKSTDSATINGSATTTVTVDTADVAQSLTLSDANATLNDEGASASLTIGATLTMSNGTLNIDSDSDGGSLTAGAINLSGGAFTLDGGQLDLKGTLHQTGGTLDLYGGAVDGGVIDSTGGALNMYDVTLSGVRFDGPLNLTSTEQFVTFANGTTVVGSSGSGPGTINVTGLEAELAFDNSQTLSNTTIVLGVYDGLFEDDVAGAGNQVLTLASSVTVVVEGYAQIQSSDYSGDGTVNDGTIDVAGNESELFIYSDTFTNDGAIDVVNGSDLYIEPTTFTTTASSVIEIGPDSSLTIDPDNAWTNLGSITLSSGASLYLGSSGEGGSTSTEGLGSISNSGGTIYLETTLNNSGETLNGSGSLGELTLDDGIISGGTVTSAGVAFVSGTLSGVTFDGPLNLTSSSSEQSVDLADGTTVVGSSGSGPGAINVTGDNSVLVFDNSQTVTEETINLGNSSGYTDTLSLYDVAGAGNQVLTLASSVTVDVEGTVVFAGSADSGDGIVNQGTIDQTGSEGSLTIDPEAFTNSGTIDAEATSGSLTIDPTSFANDGTIDAANGETVTIKPAVTGKGTDTISGGSTLEFASNVATAKGLGNQDIDFSSGGGTLDLLTPKGFYGEISDFGSGDTVELLGSWAYSSISRAGGVTTLTLTDGSTKHGFEFVGDYRHSNFNIVSGATTNITYT